MFIQFDTYICLQCIIFIFDNTKRKEYLVIKRERLHIGMFCGILFVVDGLAMAICFDKSRLAQTKERCVYIVCMNGFFKIAVNNIYW